MIVPFSKYPCLVLAVVEKCSGARPLTDMLLSSFRSRITSTYKTSRQSIVAAIHPEQKTSTIATSLLDRSGFKTDLTSKLLLLR